MCGSSTYARSSAHLVPSSLRHRMDALHFQSFLLLKVEIQRRRSFGAASLTVVKGSFQRAQGAYQQTSRGAIKQALHHRA